METLSFKRRKVGNKIFFCTHAVSSDCIVIVSESFFFFFSNKQTIDSINNYLFFSSTDISFLFTRKILGKIFSELTSTW